MRDARAGRISIDVSNRSGRRLQRFPEVQEGGAFQYIWWESLDVLVDNGRHLDVYIVGDDGTAKRE